MKVESMLTDAEIGRLLAPYATGFTGEQLRQLRTYLDLLMRWNQKINLTAIRTPEECVTRHFGESLLLTRVLKLEGALLDVGSGAGFPGLALKLVAPDLGVTLLEPIAKKRAFLKEVTRRCGFDAVDVRAERLEGFATQSREKFDFITARAVGRIDDLVARSGHCLTDSGKICLWLSLEQANGLLKNNDLSVRWANTINVPQRHGSVILVGVRRDVEQRFT